MAGPARQWIVHGADSIGRRDVEAFIAAVYARRYGADPHAFAPALVALHEDGEIVAAAGYRMAGQGPLFLERYLDRPVERALAGRTKGAISRRAIVEVGHLSAMRADAGWRIVRWLVPHLVAQRFQWVACTVTHGVRRLLARTGVPPVVLAEADPRALGPEAGRWGSYYAHRPLVVAGELPRALQRLEVEDAHA